MSGRGSWLFVSNKELYPGKSKTFIAFETLHHLPLVRKRGGVRKNKTFIAFETLHHLPLPDIRDRLLGNEGEYETSIAFETLHHLPLVRKRGGV